MLSSLRNFILALFFSLAVFGVGAYFLVQYVTGEFNEWANPDDGEEDDGSVGGDIDIDGNPVFDTLENLTNFTILVIGMDDGQSQMNEKKEADSIYLININSDTKKFMISPIPCDTKFTVKGYVLRLGMVMAEYGIETMIESIKALTGIMPDYYCIFEYESIVTIMTLMGDIVFDVPMDMFYMPERYPPPAEDEETEEQEPEINLKKGKQPINGEKAIQLFRYKDYSDGNIGRIATQMEFVREFIRQKVTIEYIDMAKTIYDALKENVITNMKETDFSKFEGLIFSISAYERIEIDYPGQTSYENGTLFYNPSVSTAIKRYKEYRKSVV